MIKRILAGFAALFLFLAVAGGLFVWIEVRAFDASVAKRYDVPLPNIVRSTDPQVLARGKHLAESLGGCINCHGSDFGGGGTEDFGPLGSLVYANITTGKGGRGARYSDAQLARLIKHGIKHDGTSVLFMPSTDFAWWPESDVVAVISYLRSMPPVDGDIGIMQPSALMKVLDRLDQMPCDIARRIDHKQTIVAPTPTVSVEYGSYLARLCTGCHGPTLSGGPIPGAPPSMPIPLNLTPHATGLKGWTLADFRKTLREGTRRNGKRMAPMMPVEITKNFSDVELEALWAYLQTVPAVPFGKR